MSAFAAAMVEAMHEANGIGLAAQQVGHARQICVIDLRPTEAEFSWKLDGASPPLELIMPMVLVNPKVVFPKKPETAASEEGCLSFPEIRGEIERPTSLTVKFQDTAGLGHVLECDGLFARCVQHEVDHLNGILFIERMTKAVRATIDEEVKALARRTKAGKSAAPS